MALDNGDWKLADTKSFCRVNFATKGDPNGPGLPVWPVYDENNQLVMNFGDLVKAIPMPRTREIEIWDSVNHTSTGTPSANTH